MSFPPCTLFSHCVLILSLYLHHTQVSPLCHCPSLSSLITSVHLHLLLQMTSPSSPPPPHLSGEPAASGNPSFVGWQPAGRLPGPLWVRTSWRPRAWWTGPSSCWSDSARHPGRVTTQEERITFKKQKKKKGNTTNLWSRKPFQWTKDLSAGLNLPHN